MASARYPFAIAHCNFHLRPDECDRDEHFVRQLAQHYGVPVFVAQCDTQDYARQHRLCIEDAARRMRYSFFEQLRSQHHYAAILTAHHRDDSVETFFLNLLRGTGLQGLHGILPIQGHIVRPLLPFCREEIADYAKRHHLKHVEDSSNASLQYRRNQIRHQLLPLLQQIHPTAVQNIAQTIHHLQSVEQLYGDILTPLREQLVSCLPDGTATLTFPLPPVQSHTQLLFELIRPYGFNHATAAEILTASQPGRKYLSPTHCAFLDRQRLLITPITDTTEEQQPQIHLTTTEHFDYRNIDWKTIPPNTAYFDADKIKLPLSLRHWQHGDRFQPLGMPKGTQLLSDFFINNKYTALEKQRQMLLVDYNNTILWIVGRRTAHHCRITTDTATLLTVTIDAMPYSSQTANSLNEDKNELNTEANHRK